MIYEFLLSFTATQDDKILYVLTLIAIAMIFDFITGVIAARVNPTEMPNSNVGINGILRKIISLLLMVFMIPISILIPGDVGGVPIGGSLIYTLYIGYFLMEVLSILENAERMGVETRLFMNFMKVVRGKLIPEEDKEDKEQ